MSRFTTILAAVILISSSVVLVNQLFTPVPIQIVLETGEEVVTQGSEYFSLTTVLVLLISAFLMGSMAVYLFFDSNAKELVRSLKRKEKPQYDVVLPFLREEERAVFSLLRENKGELLQNAIVLKTGYSKVKVARIVARLERKNVVVKERHGLTNRIKVRP